MGFAGFHKERFFQQACDLAGADLARLALDRHAQHTSGIGPDKTFARCGRLHIARVQRQALARCRSTGDGHLCGVASVIEQIAECDGCGVGTEPFGQDDCAFAIVRERWAGDESESDKAGADHGLAPSEGWTMRRASRQPP